MTQPIPTLGWYDNLWHWLILKTGKNILHISYPFSPIPHGDNTAGYINLFILCVAGIIGTVVWSIIAFKTLLVATFLYLSVSDAIQRYSTIGDGAPKPVIYGYYNVETFVKNRDTLLPLNTDTVRWSRIAFGERNRISVKMMNDTLFSFNYKNDAYHHTLTLTERGDTSLHYSFLYSINAENQMELKSRNQSDSLYLRLTKINSDDFLLMKRGFHWIFEEPFNR